MTVTVQWAGVTALRLAQHHALGKWARWLRRAILTFLTL